MKTTLLLLLSSLLSSLWLPAQHVLFIRGGAGTGGFLEGGADEQLSDITDYATNGGNHGWGQLADTLRAYGFTLEQRIEGPAANNTPIGLDTMDLSAYAVIVLGSNNAEYGPAAVDALETYVRQGGGALFISDANWGRDWGDAPSSDQPFLDRFGWTMNQDRGQYALNANEYLAPDHPILAEVSAFDGEGVSPITLSDPGVAGVQSTILAPAKGQVRRNDATGAGSSTPATADDASLIVATVDQGRIAGHFDRNTFFNLNGAGTNITRLDNARYAVNLFTWLAGPAGDPTQLDAPSRGGFRLYPNPAWEAVTVTHAQQPVRTLEVMDVQGRRVQACTGEGPCAVESLSPGWYQVRVNDRYHLPLLIQR